MLLRKNVNPRTIINLGLIALICASVSRYLTHRNGRQGTDVSDSVVGFLYGIAIATMLLGLWLRGRKSSK